MTDTFDSDSLGSGSFASDSFASAAGPYRRELLAHCYRMLGSVDDAEDMVQETYLRAWRAYGDFAGRASVRTWLYRIATNACLTSLHHHSRRVLPAGLGGPEPDPATEPAVAPSEIRWLQPVPDAVLGDESLRLALVASLQYLPGTQRAVLLLRDVLAFPAAEVAVLLGTTTAAVKSALQRARARLREVSPRPEDITAPTAPAARTLLDQYIAAFQNSDAAALEQLLSRDVTLEATPFRTWYAGRATCVPFLRRWVLGEPGDWRMRPTVANGQPAAVGWTRGRPYGVVVLTVTGDRISRVVSFQDPALVARFVPGGS